MENELEDIICMNLNNKQTIDLATAFIDAVQTVSASINTVDSRLGDLIEKLPKEDK